uniref:YncE family protein n=1 Tax=Paracidobacterium acidisoli TaxID=2303751 RepID=A0A372IJ89_9BACT
MPASAAPSPATAKPAILYLATWPHKIDVIDLNQEKVVGQINLTTDIARQLVLSPDHKKLYASTLADNSIVTIDLATRRVTDSFSLDGGNEKNRLSGLTIDPTGRYLYAVDTLITKQIDHFDIGSPKFIVIDLSAKQITRSVDMPKDDDVPGYRSSMKLSPDGKYLYLFRDGIQVFDASTFRLVKKIDLRQPPVPDMLNLSLNLVDDPNEDPNTVTGFFNSSDPYVHREIFGVAQIDLKNLTFDLTPVGPVTTTSMSPLMLSPDHKLGYTAVVNGEQGNRITEFWVIDMATRQVIAKKQFVGRTRFNFGLSADGKKLLIYNAGYQVEVYDAKTLEMTSDIDLEGDTTSNLIVMPAGE